MRALCRPRSPARIQKPIGASRTLGWPENVRDIRLQRERRVPAFGGQCDGVSNSSSNSLPNPRMAIVHDDRGGGRTCGAVRTVEVEPEFETPTCRLPQAATCPFDADGSHDHFPASRQCPKRRRLWNSSKRMCSAREPEPIKLLPSEMLISSHKTFATCCTPNRQSGRKLLS